MTRQRSQRTELTVTFYSPRTPRSKALDDDDDDDVRDGYFTFDFEKLLLVV